ncbi:aminoglycoside 6'-N-acetyltransferase [Paenibacillus sp. J5C2022]|uniref:aminoglycoside 6'-N-acetyltransferase n=1 Tax=Paenibacillus sp. J5C2022 TaxID=2977129 RepID=UPI0021D14EE1|nr:aminoglycoside 6'-N-acetyltransferase [Paenibacillus sp. J5C2022]
MGIVVEASREYLDEVTSLGLLLWPENEFVSLRAEFLALLDSAQDKLLIYKAEEEIVAFIHISIRVDYVEGATSSPTGFVEGIFVKPEHRRRGISKLLLAYGEVWLKERGCKEIGSDIAIDNQDSYHFHIHSGFTEASRIIAFIKGLE